MSNIANIKYNCASNGEGIRTAVYISGCTLHCKGCFNREAQDFNYGSPFTEEVLKSIIESLRPSYVQGISILGGEPFDINNQMDVNIIINSVRAEYGNTKDIWCWTGYTYEKIPKTDYAEDSLSEINVLVDGPFIESKQDLDLKFRGSSNQRILYLKNGKIDKIC